MSASTFILCVSVNDATKAARDFVGCLDLDMVGSVNVGLYVCGDGGEAGLLIANRGLRGVQPDCKIFAFVFVNRHEQGVTVSLEAAGEHFRQLFGGDLHRLEAFCGAFVSDALGAAAGIAGLLAHNFLLVANFSHY
jgi:hypothetical protein